MNRPWMPLYVADYRNKTVHLSTVEHGAYLLLIMHYWSNGDLPDDDLKLARIVCMTVAAWKKIRPTIQAFFFEGWKHKRVDDELARAADISNKRRTSVNQRYNKSTTIEPTNVDQLNTHARATSQPQSQLPEDPPSGEARLRATRLQKDWWPTAANIQYAIAKGFSMARINVEAEKFRNHWVAKSGKDATKHDWGATWENWILKAMEIGNGTARQPRKTLFELGTELADEARELERAAGDRRPDEPIGRH